MPFHNKPNENLSRRLIKYSSIAGSVLLGYSAANAGIQHTVSNTTINNNGSLNINFGGNKFRIAHNFSTTPGDCNNIGIFDLTANARWVAVSDGTYTSAVALNSGVTVAATGGNLWRSGDGTYTSANMAFDCSFDGGQFRNQANKFLGVRFSCPAGTCYGWIKVTVPLNATSVTIHEYAYEDSGASILTGQIEPPNNNPAIAVNNGAYTEDNGPTIIHSAAVASDADGDGDWDTNAKLEVQITGNAEAADEISIDTSGNFSIAAPNIRYSGTTIGTIAETSGTANDGTVTGGAMLTINFNANATNALVQELVRSIAYRSTSHNPTGSNASRVVTFTLTDKNGGSGSDTSTITITPQNDPPTDISITSTSVDENKRINTVIGDFSTTDPDD